MGANSHFMLQECQSCDGLGKRRLKTDEFDQSKLECSTVMSSNFLQIVVTDVSTFLRFLSYASTCCVVFELKNRWIDL
jgi:hypothetical protein